MTQIKLSEHFTLQEAIESPIATAKGIDNSCADPLVLTAAQFTALRMERVRALLGNRPIQINSWIRSSALNTAIGGAKTSQHLRGEAVDFTCAAFGAPKDIVQLIAKYVDIIKFDQVINEQTWVHISFKQSNNRGEVLSLVQPKAYVKGITDSKGVPYTFPA